MTLGTLAEWSAWIASGLGAVVLAVLSWIVGAARARRHVSDTSLAVAGNNALIGTLKTLQEREAATNARANRLADKERQTFERYVHYKEKFEAATRDIVRYRARLEENGIDVSGWGDLETNFGDLPK